MQTETCILLEPYWKFLLNPNFIVGHPICFQFFGEQPHVARAISDIARRNSKTVASL